MQGMDTRFCPKCGSHTGALFCPSDGIATFDLAPLGSSGGRLQPGDIVAGKYRVMTLLGQGGQGAVYEAEHLGGLGLVALKVLNVGQADPTMMRRFYREARVTSGLKHANTVRLFDLGQTPGGALFLVMERLQGVTLEVLLRQRLGQDRVLSQDEAIDIALDVLQSVSEAHGQGLIHRDLKPANIMLTEVDGERCVKVLDFGIAWAQDGSLTTTGHAVGTPTYMSPEQCSAQTLDLRSDLYALAVILFRCVAGRPPFMDPQALSLMYAHNHMPPPSLTEVTRTPLGPAFTAVVTRGLAKQPADRFDTARVMRSALQAARGEALTIQPKSLDITQDQLPVATPAPSTVDPLSVAYEEAKGRPALHARGLFRWPLIVATVGLVLAGAAWNLTRRSVPQVRVDNGASLPRPVTAVPATPLVVSRPTPTLAVALPAVISPSVASVAPSSVGTKRNEVAAPVRGQPLPSRKNPPKTRTPTAERGIEATLPEDD